MKHLTEFFTLRLTEQESKKLEAFTNALKEMGPENVFKNSNAKDLILLGELMHSKDRKGITITKRDVTRLSIKMMLNKYQDVLKDFEPIKKIKDFEAPVIRKENNELEKIIGIKQDIKINKTKEFDT